MIHVDAGVFGGPIIRKFKTWDDFDGGAIH